MSPPPSLVLQHSLDRTALESKYMEIFWTSILPNGEAASLQAARHSNFGWIRVVQDLCNRDTLVRLGLLTNVVGLIGQDTGQRSMLMASWCMYGSLLQTMARLLAVISQERNERLLVITMLIARYEVRLCVSAFAGIKNSNIPTDSRQNFRCSLQLQMGIRRLQGLPGWGTWLGRRPFF